MPLATTVVTPTRFAQGLTWTDFLAAITINRDKFEQSYQTVPLTDDDLSFFRKAAALPHGPAKILAVGRSLVWRRLPRTPHHGAHRRGHGHGASRLSCATKIPTSWMSSSATTGSRAPFPFSFSIRRISSTSRDFSRTFRQRSCRTGRGHGRSESQAQPSPTATFGNLPDAERQAFLREVIARIRPHSDQWRKDAIQEIRELLSTALKIPNADEHLRPVVYTIRGCDACVKLLRKWDAEHVAYEERHVELSQETLE